MSQKVIDVEFEDVDGTTRGGKSFLNKLADVADNVAETSDAVPFEKAREVGRNLRTAAVVAREVDGIVEDAKPVLKRIEGSIGRLSDLFDLPAREVMSRR